MNKPPFLTFADKITGNDYVEIWQDHNSFYAVRAGDLMHLTDWHMKQHGEGTAHLLALTFLNAYTMALGKQ